ncbi:NifU family protein [Pontibaca salina]|uniref:NifU family protein n=1 Tax=Pontibaca salina TaxID=2795731 RepID=A0A934M367_9RHOB|nr:DUF6522 family protein [Pontibaca salina]MBI6629549.1 NifU family protein [Pontibaca salina]
MSETPRRRIRAQTAPRDPHMMRFILDAPVQENRSANFDGPDDDAPLSGALFAIDGVRKVQVSGETVMVTRQPETDWQNLKAPVAAAIRQVLEQTDQPLGKECDASPAADSDAALLAEITDLLTNNVNPAIASHGGHISAERVENGTVYLRMSGGCQGCAASAVTLRKGVETMLRKALPAIVEIVDVTDHASGENPFYSAEPGESVGFHRPVPADHIAWEDGELAIDPEYLAPRLGLQPNELQNGLERGEVTITTERRPAPDSDQTRVVVRSAQRAWAADVLPDGTAREIPPPRTPATHAQTANTLPDRIRAYLESLPADSLPITYGRLARGLGMYAPGSIRKVTAALEDLMHEDSKAKRPFIAALVVNRGRDHIPGKGFFELAQTLGRHPRSGESEQDFHLRELNAALGRNEVHHNN